ncbi:MAG: hypothetical protein K1V90_07140 [Muribaculaceae bacterium]
MIRANAIIIMILLSSRIPMTNFTATGLTHTRTPSFQITKTQTQPQANPQAEAKPKAKAKLEAD